MKLISHKKLLFLLLILLCISCSEKRTGNILPEAPANIPVDKALYATIYSQDSALFAAFNSRNLNDLKKYFSDSLEVFQDNIGLRNYKETIQAFGELFSKKYILQRELLKNSLEVYPIKGYGAIETGQHRFCHLENNKLECATFKFVHIWKNEKGQWKIIRLITYNH